MLINTKRLVIRPIAESDLEALIAILTHETVAKTYMVPEFASREDAERVARRYIDLSSDAKRIDMGIALDGRLIGFINDVGIHDGEIELGYALHPEHHGQGYMTEALGALIGVLFEQGYSKIVAGAFKENKASMRVMEKCGMSMIEKTEQIQYRGKTHDCVYYAIESGGSTMTHAKRARELFLSGCSCSQAVLCAYAQELGIRQETALKLASSFGGGLGGSRELCGAVSGMLMVAGLKWGYDHPGDLEAKTAHYARTRELLAAFTAAHGTTVCRELLSSLKTLSENPSARTPEYYRTRPCVRFVETAASILDQMEEEKTK